MISKSLMDSATLWEITKHLLLDEHDNGIGISLVLDELDEMIKQTIRNATHIAQTAGHEIKQRKGNNNE